MLVILKGRLSLPKQTANPDIVLLITSQKHIQIQHFSYNLMSRVNVVSFSSRLIYEVIKPIVFIQLVSIQMDYVEDRICCVFKFIDSNAWKQLC